MTMLPLSVAPTKLPPEKILTPTSETRGGRDLGTTTVRKIGLAGEQDLPPTVAEALNHGDLRSQLQKLYKAGQTVHLTPVVGAPLTCTVIAVGADFVRVKAVNGEHLISIDKIAGLRLD